LPGDHNEVEQLEERRSVGASSCKSGDGTDQKGLILDVYDDDNDDDVTLKATLLCPLSFIVSPFLFIVS